MKKKTVVGGLVCMSALVLVVGIQAFETAMSDFHPVAKILAALELNNEQKEQLKEKFVSTKSERKKAFAVRRKLFETALQAAESEKFDEEAFRIEFKRTMTKMEDRAVQRLKNLRSLRSTLTADQYRKLLSGLKVMPESIAERVNKRCSGDYILTVTAQSLKTKFL